MHVNRVEIPGDGAVASPEVAAQAPAGNPAQRLLLGRAGARLGRPGTVPLGRELDTQVRRPLLPDELTAGAHLGDQVELAATPVRAQIGNPDAQSQRLAGVERTALPDPV